MISYKDIDRDSGVEAYEYGTDYIKIKFKTTTKIYTYTYQSAGAHKIEEMKKLADRGDGLQAYININKPKFVR